MFGTDEFGNTRLLAYTFILVLAALSIGAVSTSQTMWNTSDGSTMHASY